jgi:hypothetical protein
MRHPRVQSTLRALAAVSLLVPALATSCDGPKVRSSSSGDALANPAARDRVTPPQEFYANLLQRELDTIHLAPTASAAQTVYLEFNGATVEKGFNPGQSFLVCDDRAVIPPALVTLAEQTDIAQEVKHYFEEAGVAVNVVLQRPEIGAFTTAIIGGSMEDLGCKVEKALSGLAPFDVGNVSLSDLVFVFNRNNYDPVQLAKVIAHEVAHSYGVDHFEGMTSLMNPELIETAVSFIQKTSQGSLETADAAATLRAILGKVGPSLPEGQAAKLENGIEFLTELATLVKKVEADPQLKNLLSIAQTEIDKSIPGGLSATPGMDKVMAVLHVVLDDLNPSQADQITPASAIDAITRMVEIITGKPVSQTPWLANITGIVSRVDMPALMTTLNGLFQSANGKGLSILNPADIAGKGQLAKLLGIEKVSDQTAAQITFLRQQKAWIFSSQAGETAMSLLSLVKTAHVDAYGASLEN